MRYYQPSALTNKYNERSIGPKQAPQTPDNIATLLDLEHGKASRKGSALIDRSFENIKNIQKDKEIDH